MTSKKVMTIIKNYLLSGRTPTELLADGFPESAIRTAIRTINKEGKTHISGATSFRRSAFKERIFKRDNYTCQRCGAHGIGVALEIHHIDHNKKNNKDSNRVTWCSRCNRAEGVDWSRRDKLSVPEIKIPVDKSMTRNGYQYDEYQFSIALSFMMSLALQSIMASAIRNLHILQKSPP